MGKEADTMQNMEELRDMLCEELDKITKKGELSAGSLDIVDKLTHSIKSIDTIMAMDDAGYSNAGGYSYARGRGSNAKRDSMGRYSSRNMYDGGSYDGGSYEGDSYGGYSARRGGMSNRGYSRDEAMDDLRGHLHQMKDMVHDDESKRMIDKWLRQVE